MNPEEAIRVLEEHGKLQARVEFESGRTIECRLTLSTRGRLMRLLPRKRRYGRGLGPDVKDITLEIPPERTPAQRYAYNLRRLRDYMAKFGDPRAWENYRAELAAITDEQLAALAEEGCRSWFEVWKIAPDLGLPRIEPFKSTTLRTCRAPAHVIEGIEDAFGEREFSYSWRGKYDCRASGSFGADGQYRAWLSREYRGCANGHYYLLISDHQAVFGESD